ncbi:ferroxidase fet3 [Coemansia sp. RSA 518]|nr:ferroxidase fet3 [Coemansia sp. RSA 564]KAJ2173540.1 ferroxidase fet3 [Coemansia sp. RSA 560]KAJ2201431.1 ferroxidase fet3 [Coemansia sp. RSA 522]KAJ2231692.1 ferroxidase fet3 [Coemansia sp. RSA 518]
MNFCIALYIGLFTVATTKHVVVNWDISHITVNRDDYNLRRAIGVNGKLPIPPVEATVGDTLELNVHNGLDRPTTIHAHGLFQTNNTHMDGPAMITQCGIPPGDSFTYHYTLEQAGSMWLHGHLAHEISDGLRAAFIIHDKPGAELYHYDKDYLLTFEDWFSTEFADRMYHTINPKEEFPPPKSYAYGLVNGVNGNITQTLNFEPGKTYRIRLVNMGDINSFQFSLPGHEMYVIEADGEYSVPYFTDGIDIGPAQRYSVLIKAHDTDAFNYYFNATMHANFISASPGLSPRVYTGKIEYSANAPYQDTRAFYERPDFKWLNDIEMHSASGHPAMVPNRKLHLEIGNNLYNTGQHLDHINNITFVMPNVPTLFTALSMGSLAMDPRVYGPQTNAVVLKYGDIVELTINNFSTLLHPFHRHGGTFQITEYGPAGSSTPAPESFQNITVQKSKGSPMRRDTISLTEFSYVKVVFQATAAVNFFHCHNSIHSAMGMDMVFIEGPDVLQKTLQIPNAMYEMCHKQGIPTTGNAAGNIGFDFTGLPNVPTIVKQTGDNQ